MCVKYTEGLCWFRIVHGPSEQRYVGQIAYATLGVSSKYELPKHISYLHGRIGILENGSRITYPVHNPANIPNDDAVKIINAAFDQCEGNDAGEISAAPPIVLVDWLKTLFSEEKATEYARMLNDVAQISDAGAPDAQTT